MTTYLVQAVGIDGVVRSIKTDDYSEVMDFAEVAHDEGLEVREPWADITTVSQREAGWNVTTKRKLIDMSQAQKEGAAEVSLA